MGTAHSPALLSTATPRNTGPTQHGGSACKSGSAAAGRAGLLPRLLVPGRPLRLLRGHRQLPLGNCQHVLLHQAGGRSPDTLWLPFARLAERCHYLCLLHHNLDGRGCVQHLVHTPTRRKANTETSNWVILTHPGGRLLLGLFAFFICCAFSSPPTDEANATILQYVTRISMWVIKSAMVIDAAFLCFFIYCIVRSE